MELQHTDSGPFAPHFLCPGEPLARSAVLSELAAVLLSLRADSRLLVAVDGVDGAGKTTFADDLARVLRGVDGPQRRILRVTIDAFHNVRGVRYRRGRESPEGFWRDSYNLEQFTDYVLAPLASGAAEFRNRGHELTTDAVLDPEPVTAAKDAVVLIDGLFLHREELRGYWDFSVFLDVPFEVTAARMAARDGSGPGPRQAGAVNPRGRYVGGQQLYFAAADPAVRADLVLDNSRATTLRVINGPDAGYRKHE